MRNTPKLQFSLATLLVVVTASSIWLAMISNDAREQEAGVKGVESNDGVIEFDTKLDVPEWLTQAIGKEYFRDVKAVDFATNRGRKRGTNKPKASDANLKHLESLTSVETLELGNNEAVTDSGLAHLRALENLTTVYLYRTRIRGPGLAHLEELPRLRAISLNNTDLDDSGTKHLGRMPRLACAQLDNTQVTDAGMADLAKASALKTLTLRNTVITDAGLTYLGQLHQLETLDVTGTRVTVDGVDRLKKAVPDCHVAVTFGLGATPHDELIFSEGREPTADQINAKLKELKIDGEVRTDTARSGNPIVSFRLFSCTLSDRVVLSLIEHMPDLEELNLRRGLVGDDFMRGLDGLGIRYLSLQATRITDDGLQYLSRLANLEELVLTETDVTDAGLVHLESLNSVDSIMLDHTRVTTNGVKRLKQSLPNCSVSW